MACRQQLSRRLPQGVGTQSIGTQGAVQLLQSRLIEALDHGPATASNHRSMYHAEVLELAQLIAEGVHAQSGALHDFPAAGWPVSERADDRQSNSISEHYGALGDKWRLAFGAHYGWHVVHLV